MLRLHCLENLVHKLALLLILVSFRHPILILPNLLTHRISIEKYKEH